MQRRQVTLKEKLSQHYQKRDFKPKKTSASTVGIGFFSGMTLTLTIEAFVMLFPAYFSEGDGSYRSGYHLARLLAMWLIVQVVGHWWLTYFDVVNRVTKETKDIYFPNMSATPPGWKTCVTCMLDAPPRSHHCTLCNYCILKRDHHCFFTGSCVGYHNQRYFLIFCFYTTLACFYAAYMQVSYLNTEVPVLSFSAGMFYFPLVAIWQYLTGATTFTCLFVLVHLYLTIICCGGAGFFLAWQLLVIWRGQTSYEAWKQIMIYRRRSVLANVYSVFGNPLYCFLCFLVPMRLGLPEDGIKWVIEPKAEKGH